MSKFRAAPKLQSEEAFIAAAETPRKPPAAVKSARTVPVVKPAPIATKSADTKAPAPVTAALVDLPRATSASEYPWQEFDLADKTTASTQPLRLNAYQHEQLKWLATNEERSLAQILRRLIAPALEEAVRASRD